MKKILTIFLAAVLICSTLSAAAYAFEAGTSAQIIWPDMFGDQEGTLTIDPQEQTWDLAFENPYGEYLIAGTYEQSINMECTEDGGMEAFLPLDAIYEAAGEAIKEALKDSASGQPAVEQLPSEEAADEVPAEADFDAFTTIVTPDVLDFPMEFTLLPDAYNTYDTPNKGSDMVIHYSTDAYGDGVTYEKFVRIYLPYGYDPEDTETRYNVLYLQHGNDNSPNHFFDQIVKMANFPLLMDNLFDPEHGLMEPFIIVCPTYYMYPDENSFIEPEGAPAGDGRSEDIPGLYYREIVEDIIPAVESQLNVYCTDFSEEGIRATRDHRAFGGFSRGSVCTWYIFHHDLEYFRYFLPTSANCLRENEVLGSEGEKWTDEDAYLYLKEAIDTHPDLPFFICAASGDETDAPAMRLQMKAFADHTETFSYGLDPEQNNFFYSCSEFPHVELTFPFYIYNAAPVLFK